MYPRGTSVFVHVHLRCTVWFSTSFGLLSAKPKPRIVPPEPERVMARTSATHEPHTLNAQMRGRADAGDMEAGVGPAKNTR